MNTEINQKISQFLDGELSSSDEEELLLKISKDPALIKTLNRYQAVNHALKNNEFVTVNEGFLDRVKHEVDQEPHFLLPKQKIKKRQFGLWQKTSVAIAASTIIAVVLVSQGIEVTNNEGQPNDPVVAQQFVEIEPFNAKSQIDETQIEVASDLQNLQHERLKAYLQAHSDNLYTPDSLTPHPYAQIVNQDLLK